MTHKEFEEAAREHQWQYMQNWGKGLDLYSQNLTSNRAKRVWLQMEHARKGLVFYDDFRDEILRDHEIEKRLNNKQDLLLSIVLRSEHIPYNLFWPLIQNPNSSQTKSVIGAIAGDSVKNVEKILIEYAPEDIKDYLNDHTSFDTYVQYINEEGVRCGLGIEVKYTEKEYKIDKGSTQWKNTHTDDGTLQLSHEYRKATDESGYYLPNVDAELITDELRQVWRNHILGASMVIHGDIDCFKSITIFPNANPHFHHIEPMYRKLLTNKGNDTFELLTYESYFNILDQHFSDDKGKNWVEYLRRRYIISI